MIDYKIIDLNTYPHRAHAGAFTEGPPAGIEIREYAESPTSHTEATGDELYTSSDGCV